ncbi:MAG: InlB B-repeat-containing protein, partial [Anaeroplasmataceae bacterium]
MKKIVSVLILFLVSTLTLVSCKISSNDKFTVSFYDEGNIISTQLIESGKNAIKPETPVKNGYVFDNWYSESTLETIFDFNTSITKDTNIYAKWNVSGFTVTYVINGHGQAQDSLTNVTSLPTTLPELSEVGYEFKGWYTDEALTTEAVAGATITTNTTLYAKWNINTYTISFNTNGGSAVADQRVNYNEAASAPTSPTKTGYRFVGWYSDSSLNTAYDFSDSVTSSITLYAKWEEITYSVTYVINGHGQAQESLSNVTSLPTTLPELSEVGYEFKGWYTDEALTIEAVAGATITTNTTLYAKWEEITYSVTYVINGHGQAQE